MILTKSIKELVSGAIASGVFPGAAWAFGDARGQWLGAAGRFTYEPTSPPVTVSSWFDLASITKALYTTTLVMRALQRDLISLDTPVQVWLPEFQGEGKEAVTIEHLLRHTSGLAAHKKFWLEAQSYEEACAVLLKEPLELKPGERTEYSCLGFLVLGLLLVQVARSEQSRALEGGRLSVPLFYNTRAINQIEEFFHVRGGLRWSHEVPKAESVPTEFDHHAHASVQGVVHDENARLFRGAAGNAGLFGTIHGMAQVARAMALLDFYDEHATIFKAFTAMPNDASARPMGWDRKQEVGSSAGTLFGPKSFGHLGFTGTSIWIDPDSQRYAVLLTNRVHPTRENEMIKEFRPEFHDQVVRTMLE